MSKIHNYTAAIAWQGNLGERTAKYTSCNRNYIVSSNNKPVIKAE